MTRTLSQIERHLAVVSTAPIPAGPEMREKRRNAIDILLDEYLAVKESLHIAARFAEVVTQAAESATMGPEQVSP